MKIYQLFFAILLPDFGLSGTLSSSQDFKFALANLQKNFEKLAAKTDTNKLDDFLKLEPIRNHKAIDPSMAFMADLNGESWYANQRF